MLDIVVVCYTCLLSRFTFCVFYALIVLNIVGLNDLVVGLMFVFALFLCVVVKPRGDLFAAYLLTWVCFCDWICGDCMLLLYVYSVYILVVGSLFISRLAFNFRL